MKRIVNKKLLDEYKGMECWIRDCSSLGIAHHIISKGANGDDVPENLFCLCDAHHTKGMYAVHNIGINAFTDKFPNYKNFLLKHNWSFCNLLQKWLKERR